MEEKFIHSIKVPNQYKKAAKLLKKTFESGQSVKGQIFEQKHVLTNRLYALVAKISKNKPKLDILIERSSILQNEPRLDQYLCLVLMTELLFGAQKLNGESKPVVCILGYESKFREILNNINNDPTINIEQQIDVVKPRYVRVNTNILSRADALELFLKEGWNEVVGEFTDYDKFLEVVRNLGDYDFVSDMHVKNLFVFPASSKKYWAKYASGSEKKFILQDKASCLPVTLLDPPKGSIVLDMCAAPGMKTTHLAAHMRNRGKIFAVERDEKRYETLSKYVEGTKSLCVTAIHLDALLLEDMFVPNVEYILVDPSCSGSGMTNRLFVSSEKDPDRLANLTGLQSRMLSHAMKAFTKAKKIVYSTCSIHFEENEKVVQECLEMCPDWKLIKPIEFAEQWKHFGSPKFKHIGKKCLYAKEIDLTDGFFVAIFEREIDLSKPIEPYSRNDAVLERISWSLKPKFSTQTTADLESKTPTNVETVDLTENEVVETPSENGQKKKKKRKDKDKESISVDTLEKPGPEIAANRTTDVESKASNVETIELAEIDVVEIPLENGQKKKKKRKDKDKDSISGETVKKSIEEHADQEITAEIQKPKKRKKSCSDVEVLAVVDENLDEKIHAETSKKKKRKVHEESIVSSTSNLENLDDSVSCDIKKKKKKKKHDENACSTEEKKYDTTEDATVGKVDIVAVDSDVSNVKPKKKKLKNK